MKILYDLLCTQPTKISKFHGGGEYGKVIFKELVQTNKINNIEVFLNQELFIDSWILELIKENKIKINNTKSVDEVNNLLKDKSYDVIYSALPINYPMINIPENTKFIGTIHGLRTIELIHDQQVTPLYANNILAYMKSVFKGILINNEKYKEKYLKGKIRDIERVLRKLDIIITVSEHSKYSMMNFLNNIDIKKIKVLYTPQKYVDNINSKFENKYGKYILLISANRWEKNAKRAIDALDDLYTKNKLCHNTIIIGKIPKRIESKIKNKNMFIFKDYVDTEELESLYKNAELFIYPTLNEGFGMPPLEAMKYDTKVIASATTSITEILNDSVLYFNPYDKEEIAIRILQSINDESKSKRVVQYNKILQRQEEDLKKIVNLILES